MGDHRAEAPASANEGRRLWCDIKGSVGVIFALATPVILLLGGAAVDYSQAFFYQARIQNAVDTAALGVNSALFNGKVSVGGAQSLAAKLFEANAPSNADAASRGAVTATSTVNNGVYTTTVNYVGNVPVAFGFLSIGGAYAVNKSSTAQMAAATSASKTYAGAGDVWGDPHIDGADGSSFYLGCTTPAGSFYNLLSDSGLQVNVSCIVHPRWNQDVLQTFSILVGSHVVTIAAPEAVYTADWSSVFDASTAWFGQITIDGVYYPATIGTHSYLDGVVTTNITDTTSFYKEDNWVHINTPTYSIAISYDHAVQGEIFITATGAGSCGVPGGFWGRTLAGVDDGKGQDYLMASATAKSNEFYWGSCATTATAAKSMRITQ